MLRRTEPLRARPVRRPARPAPRLPRPAPRPVRGPLDGILFRGRGLRCATWHYGWLVVKFDVAYIVEYVRDANRYEYVEVDPTTVGQYIRRNDVNNIRIFECDVVETESGARYLVRWHGFDSIGGGEDLPRGHNEDMRLLGNIHDVPRLAESAGRG